MCGSLPLSAVWLKQKRGVRVGCSGVRDMVGGGRRRGGGGGGSVGGVEDGDEDGLQKVDARMAVIEYRQGRDLIPLDYESCRVYDNLHVDRNW